MSGTSGMDRPPGRCFRMTLLIALIVPLMGFWITQLMAALKAVSMSLPRPEIMPPTGMAILDWNQPRNWSNHCGTSTVNRCDIPPTMSLLKKRQLSAQAMADPDTKLLSQAGTLTVKKCATLLTRVLLKNRQAWAQAMLAPFTKPANQAGTEAVKKCATLATMALSNQCQAAKNPSCAAFGMVTLKKPGAVTVRKCVSGPAKSCWKCS